MAYLCRDCPIPVAERTDLPITTKGQCNIQVPYTHHRCTGTVSLPGAARDMLLCRSLFLASSALHTGQRAADVRCCTSFPATDALYLADASLLTTTATVLGVEADDSGWNVVLDATVFHPQGGGQPSDVGSIAGEAVAFVSARGRAGSGGVIYHAFDREPQFTAGDLVDCAVDAGHRRLSARTHSAGHLIDVAMSRCGVLLEPTKGYHWPDGAYVEYADPPETRMTADERAALLPRLQAALDAVIAEDTPTDVRVDETGTRIVTLGGLACPCGGTHVPKAGSVGVVTVGAVKKKGSGKKAALRVSYSMGEE